MDEKKQFAERLRAAMIAAGHEPRAIVLEKNFNSRYWGRSVTYQAARRWLIGLSIPEQEKLQVLAEWLRIEPQALRFGSPAKSGKGMAAGDEARHRWDTLDPMDRTTIDTYLTLPESLRQHARALIAALGRSDTTL